MKLSQLVSAEMFLPLEWDRAFERIVLDSREVKPGCLFIAVAGVGGHGKDYVAEAIEQGAVAVLVAGELGFSCEQSPHYPTVPVFFGEEVQEHFKRWILRFYQFAGLQLTAVTGTNGKSSVSQYIAQLLTSLAQPCGVLGTLGNGLWPELEESKNTTADLATVAQALAQIATTADYAALEVSSHALAQKRIEGLEFACTVFTNLSQDHLDYHGDLDSYFTAKKSLFTAYPSQHQIINIDDEYGQALAQELATNNSVITYGQAQTAQVRYTLLALDEAGMHAEIKSPWGVAQLVLPLIGEFNLANVCAAISALCVQGFEFNALCEKAHQLKPVAGRMEVYAKPNAPLAVVDFAHTPAALKNVLTALTPWQRPLITVFGCGGERDRGKRPLMLAQAMAFSQQVWVTDDNPRGEDPEQIFADILQHSTEVNTEHDRQLAITQAIANASEQSIVLIAGKGHEPYQEINSVKHPYNDALVLEKMGYQRLGKANV